MFLLTPDELNQCRARDGVDASISAAAGFILDKLPKWTPSTVPPAREDADAEGDILVRHSNGLVLCCRWNDAVELKGSSWMPLAPLSKLPVRETDRDADDRRQFEAWAASECDVRNFTRDERTGDYTSAVVDDLRLAWTASADRFRF